MAQTFRGDVAFTLHDKCAPHRFEVSVTDANKIVIWIEDRQSKKQCPRDESFVTDDNVIPKATIVDYAERFAACLGSTGDDAKYKRALNAKGSERVLVLTFVLQWVLRTLSVEYKFVLYEVPLERIHILGARVRDVEEKVAKSAPVYAQATTSASHTTGQTLVWTARDSDDGAGVEFLSTGPVRFHTAGVYAIDIGVTHSGASNSVIFEFTKASVTLMTCTGESYNNNCGYHLTTVATTPLHYILTAAANDEISVVYKATGSAHAGSYLTVVKLRASQDAK